MSAALAKLEIAPRDLLIPPTVAFVDRFAEQLGMRESDRAPLREAFALALTLVVSRQPESVELEIYETEARLVVEILNRGVPISDAERFHEAARQVDHIAVQNLGRQGQKLRMEKKLGRARLDALSRASPRPTAVEAGEIEFGELAPGEEARLSELFFHVYGYSYINEVIYYPEKIEEMRRTGKLISIVAAEPSGRLVAHVGLVRWGETPPVYEAALGLVDPRVKARGLFSKIFEKSMERIRATPMQFCFFDFVTNHDHSQRVIARHGTREMALFVGCQNRATQAQLEKLGMGEDPEDMDRYSLLYSIIPVAEHPFGREITLPLSIGEPFGFLLEPLRLTWAPASRFAALSDEGSYRTSYQPQQNAVIFDLHEPGRAAVDAVLASWQDLLRNGYQYAAVEVPVAEPGLGIVHDRLASAGFFASGFVPYHHSDRLAFRFQAIGPTKVAWDAIRLATPHARQLLSLIRKDHERHSRL